MRGGGPAGGSMGGGGGGGGSSTGSVSSVGSSVAHAGDGTGWQQQQQKQRTHGERSGCVDEEGDECTPVRLERCRGAWAWASRQRLGIRISRRRSRAPRAADAWGDAHGRGARSRLAAAADDSGLACSRARDACSCWGGGPDDEQLWAGLHAGAAVGWRRSANRCRGGDRGPRRCWEAPSPSWQLWRHAGVVTTVLTQCSTAGEGFGFARPSGVYVS